MLLQRDPCRLVRGSPDEVIEGVASKTARPPKLVKVRSALGVRIRSEPPNLPPPALTNWPLATPTAPSPNSPGHGIWTGLASFGSSRAKPNLGEYGSTAMLVFGSTRMQNGVSQATKLNTVSTPNLHT